MGNDSQIVGLIMEASRIGTDVMIFLFVFFSILMIIRQYFVIRRSDNVIYEAFRIIKTSRKKKKFKV
jgi:hypothetical protein